MQLNSRKIFISFRLFNFMRSKKTNVQELFCQLSIGLKSQDISREYFFSWTNLFASAVSLIKKQEINKTNYVINAYLCRFQAFLLFTKTAQANKSGHEKNYLLEIIRLQYMCTMDSRCYQIEVIFQNRTIPSLFVI